MHIFIKQMVWATAAAVAVAGPASAQFQMGPQANQAPFNAGAAQGVMGPGRAGNGGGFFNPANMGNVGVMTTAPAAAGPYAGGGGGYGGGGTYPPFPFFGYGTQIPTSMGNLYGSATVINSLGQYMTTTQQARLMQEHIKREKLDTRRRVIEQWLWERNNLPTTEDDRERAIAFALRRSQTEPPVTEITAGQSLNTLLGDIQRLQGRGVKAPSEQLPDSIIGQVNFLPKGKGAANAGVLKNYKAGNKLDWPLELRLEDYRAQRDLIESLTREAIQQASTVGRVDAGTLQALEREINHMSDELRANLNRKDLAPRTYNPARNFLSDLSNGLQALSDPDAKNYFTDKYTATGKTAGDLATDMQNKGLEFGPATPTQQPAYVALHRFLAAYDLALNSNASFQAETRR